MDIVRGDDDQDNNSDKSPYISNQAPHKIINQMSTQDLMAGKIE